MHNIQTLFSERDEFQREAIAENVKTLLKLNSATPMLIDGAWGVGKTEFAHKLKNFIADEYQTIYIDAFSADHADNPLLTILSAVLREIPENKQTEIINKAIPVLKCIAKVALNAGVAWFTKQDLGTIIDEFDDAINEKGKDLIDKGVESLLKDHIQADRNLDALKNSLIKLAEAKPIVIIIDELDRCRPDFALSLLETIKHIFDLPQIQFILVANLQQLEMSINHSYGASLNAQQYLDKFIKFRFSLNSFIKTHEDKKEHASIRYLRDELNTHLPSFCKNVYGKINPIVILEYLIKTHHYSLRDIEKIVRYMTFFDTLKRFPKEEDPNLYGIDLSPWQKNSLSIIGIVLSCTKPNEARKFLIRDDKSNQEHLKEILNVIIPIQPYQQKGDENKSDNKMALILHSMISFAIDNCGREFLYPQPLATSTSEFVLNCDPRSLNPEISKRILNTIASAINLLDLN